MCAEINAQYEHGWLILVGTAATRREHRCTFWISISLWNNYTILLSDVLQCDWLCPTLKGVQQMCCHCRCMLLERCAGPAIPENRFYFNHQNSMYLQIHCPKFWVLKDLTSKPAPLLTNFRRGRKKKKLFLPLFIITLLWFYLSLIDKRVPGLTDCSHSALYL